MFPFDDVTVLLQNANDSVDNDCISCLSIFYFSNHSHFLNKKSDEARSDYVALQQARDVEEPVSMWWILSQIPLIDIN